MNLYNKYISRIEAACNTIAWTVKGMTHNVKDNVDEYIKQIEQIERSIKAIKQALYFFKNTRK